MLLGGAQTWTMRLSASIYPWAMGLLEHPECNFMQQDEDFSSPSLRPPALSCFSYESKQTSFLGMNRLGLQSRSVTFGLHLDAIVMRQATIMPAVCYFSFFIKFRESTHARQILTR